MNASLRKLPQISSLLDRPQGLELVARFSHGEVLTALRWRIKALRDALLSGAVEELPDCEDAAFFAAVAEDIESSRRPNLRRVINATGIVIHTNLGRAPLAPEAVTAVTAAASSASNLEIDLATGGRGSRHAHVAGLICELTGAQDAIVVNNCAAAVLLCLTALAKDREVIASRGELIEIGGGFRIPDVIAQCGARLVEVGSTNKTRLADYAGAIGPDTAVLLKSHTSNFRIVGFTAAPSRSALAKLAQAHDLVLIEDLGSGVLVDLSGHGLADEPVVGDVLQAGVDLVTFSGDKLLGGPQAGVIAGRRDLIARLAAHPLIRALRIDKLSLAALEATLRLYRPPHDPIQAIPVLACLSEGLASIKVRAEVLMESFSQETNASFAVQETTTYVGGGAMPQNGLPSFAIVVRAKALSADSLAARLRSGIPAVVGRIQDDALLLDMRTVGDRDLADLAGAIWRAL